MVFSQTLYEKLYQRNEKGIITLPPSMALVTMTILLQLISHIILHMSFIVIFLGAVQMKNKCIFVHIKTKMYQEIIKKSLNYIPHSNPLKVILYQFFSNLFKLIKYD